MPVLELEPMPLEDEFEVSRVCKALPGVLELRELFPPNMDCNTCRSSMVSPVFK